MTPWTPTMAASDRGEASAARTPPAHLHRVGGEDDDLARLAGLDNVPHVPTAKTMQERETRASFRLQGSVRMQGADETREPPRSG